MHFIFSIGTFCVCTVIVVFSAWWFSRHVDNKDAKSFFLADRKLPWIQVAGSLLLTNLSTEQLVGLNGASAAHGAVVMAWEIVPVFALIALAWWFLPQYWSGRFTTVPEFLEHRFDQTTRKITSLIFLITVAFNVLPFLLYSGGIVLSELLSLSAVFGITEFQSVMLVAVVVGICSTVFVINGGLKAVALADVIYGVLLIFAGLLIPFLGLALIGEGSATEGLGQLLRNQGPNLNPVGDGDSNIPFGTLFTGLLFINLFYWCTNQTIVQRTFGASSLVEAQKGVLMTAGLKLMSPLYLVLPGIIAVEIFGVAVGNGDFAYAQLLDLVLPPWLEGVFAAVLFGTIISSYNGAIHSAITVFSVDIYQSWIRPKAGDQEMLVAGKKFTVVLFLIGILVSCFLHNSTAGVFTLMKWIMSAFKLPLLAVVAMGIISVRVPCWAAKCVLWGGIASQFFLEWLLGSGVIGFNLHWLHVAGLNTVLMITGLAVAARFSPRQVGRAVDLSHSIPPRWRNLPVASGVVAILAVGLYSALWYFSRV